MIREANRYDKQQIINMMQAFRIESGITQYANLDNVPYWESLLDHIFAGQGIIYIEDGIGLIIGCVMPTIWCNKTFAMYELAWYVKPEFRGKPVGYKLLKKYIDYANEQKSNGRIAMFTLSKLSGTPDLDYARLGFAKMDETWIQ